MNNLLIERLHPETQLITGDVKPFSMVQGLDDTFAGAIFVGYHARAALKGVMSHSMIYGARNMYINDVAVGELGFNAFVAGYYGVPLLMVAGDDRAAIRGGAVDSQCDNGCSQRSDLKICSKIVNSGKSWAASSARKRPLP